MNVVGYSLVSESVLRLFTPFALIIIGAVIETKYVGRVAMFTNALALYIFYHPVKMGLFFGLLINSVIILGIVAGISRVAGFSLPSQFYQMGWIASSVFTAILIVVGL